MEQDCHSLPLLQPPAAAQEQLRSLVCPGTAEVAFQQAQELCFISGSASFDDFRFTGSSIRAPVSNHLRDTCVTGDDRSYSRHVLLCIALGRKMLYRLCKSYPTFLFASECNRAAAVTLETSHLNVFPSEDTLSFYSHANEIS